MSGRTRLNVFLEPAHARRLGELATLQDVSKSALVAAALAAFLAPDVAARRETAIAQRLDRLSRQFERLERDQHLLIETVALHVRQFLTVSLPVPEGQHAAARAQGRARFAQFVEQLARQMQRRRGLRQDLEALGAVAEPMTDGATPESPLGEPLQ